MSPDDVEAMRALRNKKVDARRRKQNAMARLRGEDPSPVPAGPIRVRATELHALGWSFEAIIAASGCEGTSAGLRLIANGTTRRAHRKFAPVATLPYTLHVPESVPDECIVPSLGATRRVRALMAQGWRHEDITEYVGRVSHHISSGRYPRMPAFDWRLVDLAFGKLSSAHGGSAKSLTRARKAGYLPALAWNDIDDPNEKPSLLRVAPDMDPVVVDRILAGEVALMAGANRLEREAVVARWPETGRSLADLYRATGIKPERYRKDGAA